VIWQRADGGVEVLGGSALAQRAERIAAAIAACGVQPGCRVAALLGRRPESFALPLATWRLGAIYVPLFTGFGADAVAVRLADSGAEVLVVDGSNRAAVEAARERVPGLTVVSVEPLCEFADVELETLVSRHTEIPGVHETALTDPATIMYTSGTTGLPKGCVIPHRGIITLLPFVTHCLALAPDEVLFSSADTGWSFGLYTTGLAPLACGATRLLYEPGFDAAAWWAAAGRHGATQFASAPTGYRQLAAAGSQALSPDVRVREATSAGEPLTGEILAWFERHVGATIHDSYGLTELGMVIANLRGPGSREPRTGSIGVALPGFAIELRTAEGAAVGLGDVGRIAVRDDGWLLGSTYWNRPQEWTDRVHDGWWITDDLARCDDEGRFWYLARADDVIVTAGYNVGPSEVEGALLEHPAVLDVACVGEPDDRKGQVVVAHAVLAEGVVADARLLEELRAWVGSRVGWHAAPRRLHAHDALPRTDSGKLVRRGLHEEDLPA
jgi:acetyl-CoA synthetase